MPQVPYDPTPNVRPSGQGVPSLNVGPVSENAFGGGIARAEQGFGGAIEKAGETLSNDIIYAQNLKNEADVNQATTDYLIKSGELDNNFRLMQGKDPQANIKSHVSSLQTLRESTRDSLGNPMAQKMFDRETMRRFGYDVVNASNYAATQMKQYNKESYENLQMAGLQRAVADPNNTGYLKQVIENTKKTEDILNADAGLDPTSETAKLRVQAKVGRLVKSVTGSLAQSNAAGAQKLLDNMKDEILPSDYLEAKETIKTRSIQQYAALNARSFGAGGTLLDRARAATRVQESGGDYGNVTTTNKGSALGAYGIMEANLGPWSQEALGHRVTRAEFLASPDIQDKIYDVKMGQYIAKYGVEGAGQAWLGGEGSVGKVDRRDPLGTSVGSYGRDFARRVGVTMGDVPEVNLPDVMRKGEQSADELGRKLGWNDFDKERYMEQFLSHAQRNSTLLRTQINQEIKQNRVNVDSVLYQPVGDRPGPTSLEEAIKLNPNFQQLWDTAHSKQPSIDKHILDTFAHNAKEDVPMTPERQARWDGARGLAITNPDEFLKLSPASLDLPRRETSDLSIQQKKMSQKLQDTSHVNSALRTLGPMLNEAGVVPSHDPAKAQIYNQFVGALATKIQAEQDKKKAPLNEEEQRKIGAELLTASGEWRWFGQPSWLGSQDMGFQVPQDAATRLTQGFKQFYNTDRNPTPTELYQMYQREVKKNARTRP